MDPLRFATSVGSYPATLLTFGCGGCFGWPSVFWAARTGPRFNGMHGKLKVVCRGLFYAFRPILLENKVGGDRCSHVLAAQPETCHRRRIICIDICCNHGKRSMPVAMSPCVGGPVRSWSVRWCCCLPGIYAVQQHVAGCSVGS